MMIQRLEPRLLFARPDDIASFGESLLTRRAELVAIEVLAPVQFEQMRYSALNGTPVPIPQDGTPVDLGGFDVNIPKKR